MVMSEIVYADMVVLREIGGSIKVVGIRSSFGGQISSSSSRIHGILSRTTTNDDLACDHTTLQHTSTQTIALLHRGNCTFATKVLNAQNAGATAAIIINSDNSAFQMSTGDDKLSDSITIPSFMVPLSSTADLSALEQSNRPIEFYSYQRPVFDVSVICLLLIAVSVIILGAFWGSLEARAKALGIPFVDPDIGIDEIQTLTEHSAYSFIIIASIGLLLLFFFINSLIYVLLILFLISGGSSLSLCLPPVLRQLHPSMTSTMHLKWFGDVEICQIITLPLSYGLAVFWFFSRHSSFSWILQDIMGISLLLVMQRCMRLPNIKISTILLSLAFIYDIFWVFLSPLFFQTSVMVHVATGGGTGEAVPMLLRFPRLNDELGGYSMLGLGDIALPGLFISYILRFDYEHDLKGMRAYFPVAVIGYTIGLFMTDIALVMLQMGQPALLYLVPSTLGVILLLAKRRGDLLFMWNGSIKSGHHHLSNSSEFSMDTV